MTAHTPVTLPAVAATTSSTGFTEGKKCSVCGTILKAQQVTPMLDEPTVTTPTAPSTPQEAITITTAPSKVKAKAKKNKVTVTWKKIKKTKKTKALLAQIKGIQVEYSTDPTFTGIVTTVSVGKKKTKVVLKLQRKTIYYVRVRYIDGAGGVSNWSAVKTVKTK